MTMINRILYNLGDISRYGKKLPGKMNYWRQSSMLATTLDVYYSGELTK